MSFQSKVRGDDAEEKKHILNDSLFNLRFSILRRISFFQDKGEEGFFNSLKETAPK